jgi:hypothetical protein
MSNINLTGKVYNLRELEFTRDGQTRTGCEFTLARRTGRKHKEGERKGQAVIEFYRVKCFNTARAAAILEHVSNGDYLSVTGEPVLDSYDRKEIISVGGKKVRITLPDYPTFEVHLERFDFCTDAPESSRRGDVLEAEILEDDVEEGEIITGGASDADVTDTAEEAEENPPF